MVFPSQPLAAVQDHLCQVSSLQRLLRIGEPTCCGCKRQGLGGAVLLVANSSPLVPGPRPLLTVPPRRRLQHPLSIHTPKPQLRLRPRPSLGLSPLPAFGLLSTSQVRGECEGRLSDWVQTPGVSSKATRPQGGWPVRPGY